MMSFFKIEDTHYLGIAYWVPLIAIFAIMFVVLLAIYPPLIVAILTWIFILAPLWAPIVLGTIWWAQWIKYIRANFIAAQTSVLLEIKLPRQILKTPKAMEAVFSALHVGPGETTFISRSWEGKVRPWWSLEIASIEGKIHFYVWAWEKYQDFIESQFYAQYPDIEIHQVEDYSAGIQYDSKKNNVWGMEYTLNKADAYPIKSYIDFELDQDPKKVEHVVDPLSGVFEKLSSLGPGEQMWIQILIRQNKGVTIDHTFGRRSKSWKDEAQEEIERIYEKAKPTSKDPVTAEITEGYPQLKPAEVNVIKALERSVDKQGFDAGVRAVYITKPDVFKGNKIPTNIVNLWSTFGSGYLNKFVPGNTWHVSLDYPWQDFRNMRAARFSRRILDAYRRRSLFHPPYERPRFVLTTEELATIYHFPTAETKAPGIQRISSTKGDAPTNLPT
mgnify:CR=1 FL=1|tara:strand:+ start:1135 stop:2466 length:1332 start_codon:yes stop_codon:yes gene_type:complete